jgi:hypothetical protein
LRLLATGRALLDLGDDDVHRSGFQESKNC